MACHGPCGNLQVARGALVSHTGFPSCFIQLLGLLAQQLCQDLVGVSWFLLGLRLAAASSPLPCPQLRGVSTSGANLNSAPYLLVRR